MTTHDMSYFEKQKAYLFLEYGVIVTSIICG